MGDKASKEAEGEETPEQLESLRAQYEDQVSGLREQLDTEGGDHEDEDPAAATAAAWAEKLPVPDISKQDDSKDEPKPADTPEVTELEDTPEQPQVDEETVLANLEQLQRQVMENLRAQLSEGQQAELDKLQDDYNKELRLQLQALKLTLTGVHQSQLKVIREDLAATHQKDKDEMEKKLWKRHKVDLDRIQKDVVKSEAEWFIRMQEMAIRQKKNYEEEREKALKQQAERQREDMKKVVDRLSRTQGYLKKLKEQGPGADDIERFLTVEKENEKLTKEVNELRVQVHGQKDMTPLKADEREELQIKISRLEEQLQASWDIMARLRAEDGSKDFNQLPTDVKELQLRVSEMEVEVSRLEVACTNEQERLAKATAAHKEEVTSLQAQLDAARADILEELEYEIRTEIEAEKDQEIQLIHKTYEAKMKKRPLVPQVHVISDSEEERSPSRLINDSDEERCPSRLQDYEADFTSYGTDSENTSSGATPLSSPTHKKGAISDTSHGKGAKNKVALEGLNEASEVDTEESLEEGEDLDLTLEGSQMERTLTLAMERRDMDQGLGETVDFGTKGTFEFESEEESDNTGSGADAAVSKTSSVMRFEMDEEETKEGAKWSESLISFEEEDKEELEAVKRAMTRAAGNVADDVLELSGEEVDSDDESALIGDSDVHALIKRRLMGTLSEEGSQESEPESTTTQSTVRGDQADGGAVPYEAVPPAPVSLQEQQQRLAALEQTLMTLQEEHDAEMVSLTEHMQSTFDSNLKHTSELYETQITEMQRTIEELKEEQEAGVTPRKDRDSPQGDVEQVTMQLEAMQTARDQLREQYNLLELDLNDKLDELKETKGILNRIRTDLVEAHEVEMKKLISKHEKEIQRLREDLSDSHFQELETTKAELMHKYDTEMDMLQKRLLNTSGSDDGQDRDDLLNEIESLKMDMGKKEKNILELNGTIRKMERDYKYMQQELEEAHKSELDAKLSEEIHNFHSQFEEMKRELTKDHQDEMEQVREKHAEELANVAEDTELLYQTKIRELEQEQSAILNGMEDSLNQLQTKHQEEIENIRNDLRNDLEAEHLEQLQAAKIVLMQKHLDEIAAVRAELQSQDTEKIKFYQDELESKTKKVEELRLELANREQEEEEKLEALRVELEKDHQEKLNSIKVDVDELMVAKEREMQQEIDRQVHEQVDRYRKGSNVSSVSADVANLVSLLDSHSVEDEGTGPELIQLDDALVSHTATTDLITIEEVPTQNVQRTQSVPVYLSDSTPGDRSDPRYQELQYKSAVEFQAQKLVYEVVIDSLQSEMYTKLCTDKDQLGMEYEERIAELESKLQSKQQAPQKLELLEKVSFDDDDYESVRAKLTQHYEEKQAELSCSHERAMSDLREEHAREIQAMKDRHREEMAPGSRDAADGDRPHVNGHSNDVETVKEELMKEREQLEKSWEAERESLNEKITKLEGDMERVKEGHLAELEGIKISIQEELLAQNMRKLDTMTDELERSHMADLDEQKRQLQLQYQELIDRLQEELRVKDELVDNRVQELQEKHEQELCEVRKEAERVAEERVSQAKEDIVAEHTEQLSAAALDTDSSKDALVAAHTQELQDLIREHKNNLDSVKKKLADKHEKEMEELNKENEAKTEKLKEAHETEMEALKKEHEDKLAELHKENAETTEHALHDKEMEAEAVQAEIEGQMFELQTQLDRHRQEDAGVRAKLEARVTLLQEELQAAEEALDRNGEASDEVADLKERLADRTEQIERLSKQLGEKNEELEQTHTLADDLEQKLDEQKQEYELLIGRFNREQEEEENLMTMVKADLEKANSEKESTNSTNEKLRNILSDTVMNAMNLEERITRQMASLVNEGRRHGPAGAHGGLEVEETFFQENSSVSDEGLDLSQRISESLFIGPDMDTDAELVADSSNRLQAAIDNLLDLVAMTTRQLQEAQETQRGLAETVEARNAEMETLTAKVDELDQHLKDETEARQFLAVELNKAEGLVDGYATEKRHLEDNISGLEEKRAMLVVELERSQSRLSELQEAELTVAARQAELERQKEALEASVGMEDQDALVANTGTTPGHVTQGSPSIPGLLAENNRLNEEKREIAKQHATETEQLSTRVHELEEQIEELESDHYQRLEDKKAEVEDLEKQIEVLDKKLKSNQQFLEEQAVEREQEREDFQKEIQHLQMVVKDKERQEGHENRLQRELEESGEGDSLQTQLHHLRREVADLEEQLKEKIDSHSQLSLKKEQLDRDLEGQQTVLQGQTELIGHLEEELDARAKSEKQLQQKLSSLEAQFSVHDDSSLEPPESPVRGSREVDDLQRQIRDLEAQIEHLQKNDELLRQQKQQLEEQLINLKTLEEELIQAKEALQQQVYDQLNQISSLKCQVDEMKLGADHQEGNVGTEMKELRRLLQEEKEATQGKEQELLKLADQLNQIRELVVEREDQLQQMESQLNSTESERQNAVAGMEKKLKEMTQENNNLKSQVATLRDNAPSAGMPVFAQALIDEKNEEIDELNAELNQLRAQLKTADAEAPITASVERTVSAPPSSDISAEEKKATSREIWALRDELERKTMELEELREANRNGRNADKKGSKKKKGGDMRESTGPDLSELVAQVRRLEEKLEDKQAELSQAQQAVSGHRDDMTTLQEVVSAKEALLTQMAGQVSSLQGEVEHLTDFQAQLQEDYDMVQSMLEKKQKEIEALSKELEDARPQAEGISADVQAKYEDQVSQLEEALKKQHREIEKREEDLFALREKLHNHEEQLTELRSLKTQLADMEVTLVEKNHIISSLEDRLHAIHPDSDPDVSALQRKISDQGEEIQRLHSQLQRNAHPLTERVSEFNRAMQELEEQKRNDSSLSNIEEGSEQASVVRQEFERQLSQLKSSHAEDMQRLKQQHAADVDATRREMQKLHHEEVNRLLSEHERELQRWRHAMDNNTDDESLLELGSRLQSELDQNEHLDSRLISLSQERLMTNGDADTIEGELTERLKAVLEKVHREGVRVLSLSELQLLQRHRGAIPSAAGAMPAPDSWQEERRSLIAALQSLQDLLGRLQGTRDVSKPDPDWRGDLMRVVGAILSREREELLSNLGNHAQRTTAVEQLEKQVKEQDVRHTKAMKQVASSDRRSLLGEIQDLRQRLTSLRAQRHDESDRLREDVNRLHDEYNKKERQLKRQMELLEYRVQQERVVAEDLRSSLEVEKSRTLELSSQLSREKGALNDLQNDLEDTQNQLTKLQQALDREQNRLLGASNALDEERNMTAQLNKALTMEQASSNQIQEEFEDERRRYQRNQERHAQAFERLKQDLAHEKDRRGEMGESLERERVALASTQRELSLEKDQHRGMESKYKAKVAEMRAALEMEKARCEEANSALQRERQLNNQLREILDEERGSLQETSERERLNITELQAMLDLERGRLVELQANLERERAKVHDLNNILEVQKAAADDELQAERTTCRHLKNTIDGYQVEKQDLARQLQFESEKSVSLATDCTRLQQSLLDAKERLRQLQAQRDAERVSDKQRQRDQDRVVENERHRQGELDTQVHTLRQKVTDLELQLAEVKRSEIQAREERDLERLRSTLSPHRSRPSSAPGAREAQGRAASMPGRGTPRHTPEREVGPPQDVSLQRRELESLRQRMQLLVVRHQEELARSIARIPDGERRQRGAGLELLRKALKNLSAELEKIHNALTEGEISECVTGLNEKILVQNSELTSLVSQLSDEKHQAMSRLNRAESELRQVQDRSGDTDRARELSERLSSERAAWAREQAALTMQLHAAEKEALRLKNEQRHLEIQLEREREKYFQTPGASVPADKEKMQRLYGKYLRAESFRKALVYQKKYLLLLLGGFQDCEEATLSMIAKLGGHPNEQDLNRGPPDPLTRFRSAARVVVALTRMKFLVRKWRRATRVGSSVVAGNSAQTHSGASSGYVPTASSFSPARKTVHAGSGRVSFQTPPTRERPPGQASDDGAAARRQIFMNGAENGFGGPADGSPSGEGDESLSAYIEQLESLQARLGTVAQSSNDFSQARR